MSTSSSEPAPITAVIFDFHATLVDERDTAGWIATAWRLLGHRQDPVQGLGAERFEHLRDHLAHIWHHAHTIDPLSERDLSHTRHQQVFTEVMAMLPDVEPALADALYTAMPLQWVAYDDALPVLKALHERGLRIGVLSNIGLDIREELAREGLAEFLDAVVLSFEVGAVKPQPEIFQRALDLLERPAAEVLMVGDSWIADAGAAQLGIRTLLLPRTSGPVHGLDAVLRLVGG